MGQESNPQKTLRAVWLGQQLRELRESRGMTVREAAEYIQRTAGTLSRFENAQYPIRRGDVLALLDLYGVTRGQKRNSLLQLANDVWQRGWWDGYADSVDQQFVDYVWLEQRALAISSWDAMIVPGLAQTQRYAEALIRAAATPGTPEERIARWVELRITRQRVLARDSDTKVSVVLDESVLHRPIGGKEVLREQLAHLIDLSSGRDVEIRVLPLDQGAHPGIDGMFTLFELPDPYPDLAYAETIAGRIYVESPGITHLVDAYDGIRGRALGPKQSARLITAAMKELP